MNINSLSNKQTLFMFIGTQNVAFCSYYFIKSHKNSNGRKQYLEELQQLKTNQHFERRKRLRKMMQQMKTRTLEGKMLRD